MDLGAVGCPGIVDVQALAVRAQGVALTGPALRGGVDAGVQLDLRAVGGGTVGHVQALAADTGDGSGPGDRIGATGRSDAQVVEIDVPDVAGVHPVGDGVAAGPQATVSVLIDQVSQLPVSARLTCRCLRPLTYALRVFVPDEGFGPLL